MHNKLKWLIIPVGIFLLNAGLKSLYLGGDTIDIDEPYSIHYALRPLSDIYHMAAYEIIPPLFYFILHFWIKVFGTSAATVRFLPMLFASLTAVIIYLTGTRFYNLLVGIGAAVLFTLSNLVIMESHDTRAYTLFMFLCTASMYVYLLLVTSQKTKHAILLTVVNLFILFTNPFGLVIIGVQVLYTIVHPTIRNRIVKQKLLSTAVLALLYLPYFFTFTLNLLLKRSQVGDYQQSSLNNIHMPAWAFSNYDYKFLVFAMGAILVFLGMLIVKKVKLLPEDHIILGWFFIPYILLFLISLKTPVTNPKYFLFIAPAFYIIVAVAINSFYGKQSLPWTAMLHHKVLWVIIIVMIGVILRLGMTTDLKVSNYAGIKDVVEIVNQKKSDSTAVLLTPRWLSLSYAYHNEPEFFKNPQVVDLLLTKNVYSIQVKEEIPRTALTKNADAIFIIARYNAPDFDIITEIDSTLKEKFANEKVLYDTLGYKVSYFY